MDDPPVWGLGKGLITPYNKTLILFFEKAHRILRGIFLSDRGYYCKYLLLCGACSTYWGRERCVQGSGGEA
jgi:hypothetical protein